MEDTFTNGILTFVIIGVTTMIAFVSLIITYITISQRKAAKQQLKMQEMKVQHQKDIFKGILATQEKERKRIAQNLHDEIGTSLSATGLMLSQVCNIGTLKNQETISNSIKNIDKIVNETRRVVNDLSPSVLVKFGLFAELKDITKLMKASANIDLVIDSNIEDSRLCDELELMLYRIIKEFCNNTLKYASASKIVISIQLQEDNCVHVEISDNGVGFDINSIKKNGHGLKNMESRVYLMEGKSELISKVGAGTKLKIELPLTKQDLEKINSTV